MPLRMIDACYAFARLRYVFAMLMLSLPRPLERFDARRHARFAARYDTMMIAA